MFFKQNLTPTLPILGFFNKIWSVLGLIPYNWNQEKGEYSECGKIKYAYWVFSAVFLVGIQTLYVNFQFISFIQAMNANNLWGNVKSMGDFTVVTNIWLTYITFSLYNLNTVLHYSDLVKFYNEHIRYRKELRNTSVYLRNNLPIMYPLLLVVPLRFASLVSACISNPDSPIFVYSAFPSSWKTPIGHGIFVGMFIPFCATFWVTLQFNVTTITMHVATVGTGIKHCPGFLARYKRVSQPKKNHWNGGNNPLFTKFTQGRSRILTEMVLGTLMVSPPRSYTFASSPTLTTTFGRIPKETIQKESQFHPTTGSALPGVLDFLADVRRLLDVYTKSDGQVRCMMVEAAVPDDKIMSYYGTKDRPIAHFPFNFHLLGVRPENNAKDVLNLINIWYDLMPEGEWPTFLIGNHDNKRAATRWTENGVDGANMINLILKGTAVTYYGEELDKVLAFTRTPVEGSFDSGYLVLVNLSEDTVTVDASVLNGVPAIGYPIIRSVGYHDSRVIVGGVIYTPESQALNSDKVLAFARIPSQESNATGYVVLVNLSDDQVSVNSGVFTGIPSIGTVHIRSVDFHNGDAVIGGSINLTSVLLGPRDSIVIVFTPTF
ncbi:unnamed protein product [Allacma fusca]|uniref:Glycosyl hydrolase family 13 catalytic domain-containing protein n=1 Tax=Allacma fusca TaxID=39272 RepID=A0A8J2P5W2_9HEXA|nr:unnamed protein product [Allacma fusca]